MRVFAFYWQKPGLARGISGAMVSQCRDHFASPLTSQNFSAFRQAGLTTKLKEGHSTENSEEPLNNGQAVS